ncbi:hypothetical protein RJ639_034024 [Escallonia herrerae]|uniref:Transposase (putative) gypsy type domain-containing protein n=1 Tax=Escallonia herrerae TaxID=1293975 RepID=A0AA88WW60_9ASTE|nr:hypothetical protein RJ639_034024 [Escallonia herrerae]
MSETSASVSSSEENIYISSSSSSSERVPTLGSEVGTSNPQLQPPSTSQPLPPSSPPQPSTSQPPHSLYGKNALGDVKDQAEDKANPKPWYTADEKSSKMSAEDLQELIREYPLPERWYAHLPGLQEPANYGTKFETGIYEEQVKSGYRLPLHSFALRFFEHYHMAPGQLVPNGWRKLVGLIHLVQTLGYKPDATYFMRVFFEICFVKGVANCPGCHIKLRGGLSVDEPLSEEQLEWAKIIPPKPIPAGLSIPHPPLPAIPSVSSAKTIPLEMASGSEKSPKGGLLGMYASGSEMLSRFEMARQVAAEEAQQKREAIKEAQEATHRAEELSKQDADHLAQIATLEKRLERAKMKAAEEAKEMFAEHFPDIPLDDFVLPAVVSPFRETAMPSEAGDAAASHLPGEGPSSDAPEP